MARNGSTAGWAGAASSARDCPTREALGAWPACLLLLAFSWTELVYPNAASPAHIAWLAIAYSALTWAGMLAFGRDAWLRHGEVFSLVFGTLRPLCPDRGARRPPASAALRQRAARQPARDRRR